MYKFLISGLTAVFILVGCTQPDYEVYSTIVGEVTDYETGAVLENVIVTLVPSSVSHTTDANGQFSFENIDAGQYTISAQKSGYVPNRKNITAVSGETIEANFTLSRIGE